MKNRNLRGKNIMNRKIYSYIKENLTKCFHLPRYAQTIGEIGPQTQLDTLPWTPARRKKFQADLEKTFGVDIELAGTLQDVVGHIDRRYMDWFFGEVWKPRTDTYQWSGYRLVEEINKTNPKRVVDIGCGFHPFKGRIPNLVGIDPFNNCADYEIDLLDYHVGIGEHDHVIALGSINFGSQDEIEKKFAHAVSLLAPRGCLWMRANPGHDWKHGPWVDIFPWSFAYAHELAAKYNLDLVTVKQDSDRLFMLFVKI